MPNRVTFDTKDFRALVAKMEDLPNKTMAATLPEYQKATPVKSGYARSHTVQQNKTTLLSDYAYAGRLEDGWSKQAPSGMTNQTINKMPAIVDKLLRGL